MKIAVTGANGYIAGKLIEHLARLKVEVVAFARNGTTEVSKFKGLSVRVIENGTGLACPGDIDGCFSLIHLAGRAHSYHERESESELLDYSNHLLALKTATAAAEAGVRRFVQVSTVSVHGNWSETPIRPNSPIRPLTCYATSKWAAECSLTDFCGAKQMQLCIVRPPLVYGPVCPGNFTRLVRLIRSGIPLPFKSVRATRSFINVHNLTDFLATCARAAESYERRVFVVGDGSDWTMPELILEIAAALEVPGRMLSFSPDALRILARIIGFGREMDSMTRSLEVDWTYARDDAGWTPPVMPKEAFSRTMSAYKQPQVSVSGHDPDGGSDV
jgi:UDP-glucose 4-epimerase